MAGNAGHRAAQGAVASWEADYLAALALGGRALMEADNWAEGVDRLLAEIGRVTGASRVWVFQLLEFQEQAVIQDYVFEWAASPAYRQLRQRRFRFFRSGFGDPAYRRLVEARRNGERHDICVPSMPEGPLRRHLESQGIRSMATVPLFVHGEWWGTLGIDDCERAISWAGPGLDLLSAAGQLIAAALYRHQLCSRSRQLELFHQVADCGVWEVALNNGRVWCSRALKVQLGYPATYPRIPLRRMLARLHGDDRRRLWQEVRDCLAGRRRQCRLDVRLVRGGQTAWYEILADLRQDASGRPLTIAGILVDIRRRKQDEERARVAAESDALTETLNRRGLRHWLEARAEAAPVHLVLLDVDHFKAINDRHGHPAGDELLSLLTRRLRHELREGDGLARLGGEEFAVLVERRDDAQVMALAERLRRVVVDAPFHFRLPGQGAALCVEASVSLGVARLPDTGESLARREALALARADEALYAAKQAGRNRVHSHAGVSDSPAMEATRR
ncbi:sensor domain-containing diguanylate cyclase [Halomonas koreensis]|uniref:diguanylate cyclase n=1 Tax=Halomonas koreensis TaxID=245385 RepID=A0ABU1G3H2_9GAMM|nr:diguanylate cyclase [Halomonas koreensis]MDR5867108.1 diguanylate cyclase [Halomonas koreensis]